MAALPSQRLKYRRYREKHDPLTFDLIIFAGLLLLAVSFALNEMELRHLRSSETAYISTVFLLSFIAGSFRHTSPRLIGLGLAAVAFVAVVNVVASTLSIAYSHFIAQDTELCERFHSAQLCFEHRITPPSTPTGAGYLVKILAVIYAGFVCYANLRKGVFSNGPKDP